MYERNICSESNLLGSYNRFPDKNVYLCTKSKDMAKIIVKDTEVTVINVNGEYFPAAHICGHRDLPGTTPKACPCLDTAAVFGFIE
jgi:predicted ribosome-associated RNA-binding protein Tma20